MAPLAPALTNVRSAPSMDCSLSSSSSMYGSKCTKTHLYLLHLNTAQEEEEEEEQQQQKEKQ